MTNRTNFSATRGQMAQISNVLNRLQHCTWGRYDTYLVWEDWDWLVVLQCLQDHGLFKSNPKRPPLGAFVVWLHGQDIVEKRTHCSMREMSLANTGIRNARYPWADVTWEPNVLRRWRILYRTLDKLLTESDQSTHTDV